MFRKFYDMADKPLKHGVYCNSKCVIPKGAIGVKIGFRQSHLKRFDQDKQKFVPMNVYIWKGKMYHA